MSLLTDYPRLREVARYAEEHIRASARQNQHDSPLTGPEYRWQHTLRVTQYGLQIAQAEAANLELVAAACLLHDSEWFSDRQKDERSHGRLAAWVIRPFLEQTGYTPEEADNICYSVAVHVDGTAGYAHDRTLESKVVGDADNVDRFGALRAIFWLVDMLGDYPTLINKLEKRLKRLEDFRERQVMETDAGNRLFNQKLDFQIDFYKRLIAEHKLTRLPD
jgi:uncharacterized protein